MAPFAIPLAALIAAATVAPTGSGNGTTLPFQRHVVRVQGTYAAVVQQQGSNGRGLELYRSADGVHWTWEESVQHDPRIRDTADLIPDGTGSGFFLVYGVEPQSSQFGPYANSRVVVMRYQRLADGSFGAELGPVTLFSPGSGQGYFRPSITRDSTGVLHVAATFYNGVDYRWQLRSSRDGGVSWTAPQLLAWFGSTVGSGKVLAYANRVAAIYDTYGGGPGRMLSRPAGAGGMWNSPITVASDGLYHGGAFSAVATPDGKIHLGYSDKSLQQLHHRRFDGSSWSGRTTIEPVGYWSNQPALTAEGNAISFAWNHKDDPDHYRVFQRTLSNGSWSGLRTLDGQSGFKGYTSAIESVAAGERALVLWSWQAGITLYPALILCTTASVP